ncbi:hypothetical protein VZQ01_34175 [Myxococcus faecalis]|uniref:toxin-antitoxin system YwqK family antitoxin n=1 Tax=Myxococcus TaxID=32 RepID=UPI001CBABD57|nr:MULTISPECIES: hypothetical protein [unclassified Myxococcus]MBZ4398974.1 hypothetical protein [Myxococcus sp. AS-1-15]MBZ4407236.1 hypothetical protein [Myxococcus sp. XM-1-1-1]BDT35993.1 MORN repeat-containing protein [Myxococcus sp. MH1]
MAYRHVVLAIAVVSAPALAGDASAGQGVRLECPAGTTQKGSKPTKDLGVFCIKTGGSSDLDKVVRHGPYVDFWANGQKQSEGQFKDNLRTGRWTFYDANGVKTGETEFERNDYHGKRVEYFANGTKKLEQAWVKGLQDGLEVVYAEDGRTVSQARFAAGKPVSDR